MNQALGLQFERMLDELVQWRAVPDAARPPAAAPWWGVAIDALDCTEPMPADWCRCLDLRTEASLSDGARAILSLFEQQTELPSRTAPGGDACPRSVQMRELHPLPSDDSAFQP